MGPPSEGSDPQPGASPDGDDHEGDHHGLSLGTAIGLNVAINAVLNAFSGYGIAWLHWKEYDFAWISHHAEDAFESAFVVEDLIVQGASTAVIVTLIVGAILHRQWDTDELEPGVIDGFVLDAERTRSRHMVYWAVGTAIAGAAVAALIAALSVSGGEHVSGSRFAFARTVNGLLVGGAVGGLVTASWVSNFSTGQLVESPDGETVAGRAARRSARRAGWVLVGVLVVSAGLAGGLDELDADANATAAMPRGTDSHDAAENLSERMPGVYEDGVRLQFVVDPDRCRRDSQRHLELRSPRDVACGNITDEVYVRAMEGFFEFVRDFEHEPGEEGLLENATGPVESPVRSQVGIPSFLKLANWTLAGGQDTAPESAFSLPSPDNRGLVNAAEEASWEFLAQPQSSFLSGNGRQATVLYTVREDTHLSSQQIGAFFLAARNAYLDAPPQQATWEVFRDGNPPVFTVDQPLTNTHRADLVEEDVEDLGPLVAGALFAGLLVALRNVRAAALVTSTVALGLAWTLGSMGLLGVPVDRLSLLLVPWSLGVGLAFTVPAVDAYQQAKQAGASDEEALTALGDGAMAPAMWALWVGILTLGVLALGPSLAVAEFAGLAILAMVCLFVLAVTLVPAALVLAGEPTPWIEDPGRGLFAALGARLHRHRLLATALVLALAAGGLAGVADVEETGIPSDTSTWPEDDELRREHFAGLSGWTGTDEAVAQIGHVVVEGDLADPQALAYLDQLRASLDEEARGSAFLDVRPHRDLPSTIRTWLKACCGPQSFARGVLSEELGDRGYDEQDRYPDSKSQVNAELEAMFATPFQRIARPVVAYPTPNVTVSTVIVRTEDPARVDEAWRSLTQARSEAEDARPRDVHTSFVGPTATSHHVSQEQVPWLVYAAIAGALTAALLGLAFSHDPRAGAAVGGLVGVGTLVALAAGGWMDVGLTVTSVLGIGFGATLGTAFAGPLAWRLRNGDEPERVHAGAGRAVAVVALTTAGVASLLAPLSDTDLEGVHDLLVQDAIGIGLVTVGALGLATPWFLAAAYGRLDGDG